MISHRYRCIYVKVPKCASTTMADWLFMHAKARHSFRPWWYGGLLNERIQAVTRAMNLYPDYFTFSFIRNPYERFVSTYLHARRIALTQMGYLGAPLRPDDYGTLRDFAELCRELLDDFGSRWGRDARDFFRDNAEREYGPGRIRLKHLRFVTGHARPQTDFLPDCHPEHLFGVRRVNHDPLSFIGSVENIDEDFSRVTHMLGLPDVQIPELNSSVKSRGAVRSRRYAAYYDNATRRAVEDLYAADLEFAGRDFDNGCRGRVARPPKRQAAPRRRQNMGTLPERGWRSLWSFEVHIETRILRSASVRRLLRPLKRLRGLPR